MEGMETKSMRKDQEARIQLTHREWLMKMVDEDECRRKIAELEIAKKKLDKDGLAVHRWAWEKSYAESYGSFEDTTIVPPMRYTFGSMPIAAGPDDTLQIFSVKIVQLKKEDHLCWPLQVYGFIATRDSTDPRRNLLFQRDRSNCQIITEEEPFLLLKGPSRGVVILDPVRFEVELKAKGKSESSNDLLLVAGVMNTKNAYSYSDHPHPFTNPLYGIRSKLEFTQALIRNSVEASIMVKLVKGSWPKSIPGRLTAYTASIPDQDIVLVDSEGRAMAFHDYNTIKLTRKIVSVELSGQLGVKVVAYRRKGVQDMTVFFKPKMSTLSYQRCDLDFCILGITVAWSVFGPL